MRAFQHDPEQAIRPAVKPAVATPDPTALNQLARVAAPQRSPFRTVAPPTVARAPQAAGDRAARDAKVVAEIDAALGPKSPPLASIVKQLYADRGPHPLNLTSSLEHDQTRARTLQLLAEIAADRLLGGTGDVADFTRAQPGQGALYEPVGRNDNTDAQGRSRKDEFVKELKAAHPELAAGAKADAATDKQLEDYGADLGGKVQLAVTAEVAKLAAAVEGATYSARAKSAAGIRDKVSRMTQGSAGRKPRPGYQAGDVIDAVGARITVQDTKQLTTLLERCRATLGTGDSGRILEIENMYASPKATSPTYRVIPMIVAIEVDGRQYTYELQLTTQRASLAADLGHNTTYKPYVQPTDDERRAIDQAGHEAAALDQEESWT